MATFCNNPYPPSQAELLACCAAECIATNLNAIEGNQPMVPVAVDCDFGQGDPCCNRVTATAKIVPKRQRPGDKCKGKEWDATISLRVTRPAAECPDETCRGNNGECYASPNDSYLMAERELMLLNVEQWLRESACGTCCQTFTITDCTKICGGKCGGTKLTITVGGFLFGALTP